MSTGAILKSYERVNYNYLGTMNESAFPDEFVKICKMSQADLKEYVFNTLAEFYDDVIMDTGYVYAKGTDPVCLTAHLDTVHKELIKEYYGFTRNDGTHIITSPQGIGGDDRCGVYMILNILRTTKFRPFIVFCEDEEIGGIGSEIFTQTSEFLEVADNVKFFIELDRANKHDLVFYSDENYDFHDWCESQTGYKSAWGSFSDISNFCPECGIAGVNISCGYYNAHHLEEYVVLEEMIDGIEAAITLIKGAVSEEVGVFEYIEPRYSYGYGYGWQSTSKFSVTMAFNYGDGQQEIVDGESKYSCIAQFLMDHPKICWNDVYDYYEISSKRSW